MKWLDDIHDAHACATPTCVTSMPVIYCRLCNLDGWRLDWTLCCMHDLCFEDVCNPCMLCKFYNLDRYVEWHAGFMHGELRYGPHKDVWVTTVDFGFGKVGAKDMCAAMEKSSSTFFLGGVVRAKKTNSSKIKTNTLKGTFGDFRLLPSALWAKAAVEELWHSIFHHSIVFISCDNCEPKHLVIFKRACPWLLAVSLAERSACSTHSLGHCKSWSDCSTTKLWSPKEGMEEPCSRELRCWPLSRHKKRLFPRLFSHRKIAAETTKNCIQTLDFMQQKLFHSKRLSPLIVEHFKLFNSHAAKIVKSNCLSSSRKIDMLSKFRTI